MREEIIDRKLKAQLDFFKIYAVFVIGLVTGNVNLLNRYLEKGLQSTFVLIIVGAVGLLIAFIAFIISMVKIIKLIK